MFGLSPEDWRDLILSVRVHRKKRRLDPARVAALLEEALKNASESELAEALGFADLTTLRQIVRLSRLEPEVSELVSWGGGTGQLGMSAAAILVQIDDAGVAGRAIHEAAAKSMTKEEARQLVQILTRRRCSLEEAVAEVMKTRPRVETSELIIGSFVSAAARQRLLDLGPQEATRRVRLGLSARFPDVYPQSVKVSSRTFSILLSQENAARLRKVLSGSSLEETVSALLVSGSD